MINFENNSSNHNLRITTLHFCKKLTNRNRPLEFFNHFQVALKKNFSKNPLKNSRSCPKLISVNLSMRSSLFMGTTKWISYEVLEKCEGLTCFKHTNLLRCCCCVVFTQNYANWLPFFSGELKENLQLSQRWNWIFFSFKRFTFFSRGLLHFFFGCHKTAQAIKPLFFCFHSPRGERIKAFPYSWHEKTNKKRSHNIHTSVQFTLPSSRSVCAFSRCVIVNEIECLAWLLVIPLSLFYSCVVAFSSWKKKEKKIFTHKFTWCGRNHQERRWRLAREKMDMRKKSGGKKFNNDELIVCGVDSRSSKAHFLCVVWHKNVVWFENVVSS